MGWLDSFLGKTQKNDVTAAYKDATSFLNTGADAAAAQYGAAKQYYVPYSATGQKANTMLENALGLNGRDAYKSIADGFEFDPYREWNADQAGKAAIRSDNAFGRSNSGANRMAIARANLELGSRDWNNWLDRLTGQQSMGVNVAGQQAGLDTGLGDLRFAQGQQLATNRINFGNAMAQNRTTGINNLLAAGGLVMKGFTPGWGGATPFGNAMGAVEKLNPWRTA